MELDEDTTMSAHAGSMRGGGEGTRRGAPGAGLLLQGESSREEAAGEVAAAPGDCGGGEQAAQGCGGVGGEQRSRARVRGEQACE